jgi:hypothetical protein
MIVAGNVAALRDLPAVTFEQSFECGSDVGQFVIDGVSVDQDWQALVVRNPVIGLKENSAGFDRPSPLGQEPDHTDWPESLAGS